MERDASMGRVEALFSVGNFMRGVVWNALARAAPILVAIATTPVLIGQLGTDRWALFTLALALAGSFGILDLGVSAALTRALALRIGTPDERDAADLVATALALLLPVSAAASALLGALAPALVDAVLHVPPALRGEAVRGFQVLAVGGPVIIANAALWGVLAAYQRFRAASLTSLPVSVLFFVAPMLALLVSDSLAAAIGAVVLVRLGQTAIGAAFAARLLPGLRRPRPRDALLRPLLSIGAWVTVSNTLGPLVTYADRFIVAATAAIGTVAYYVTPVDLAWRLTMLPGAVGAALFPAVAATHERLPGRTLAMMRWGAVLIVGAVFPAAALIAGGARELLTLWLGAGFAAESHMVFAIVGVGVFFSCVTALPFAVMDGIGRPDVSAWVLIVHAILFPPVIAVLSLRFGIEGAALGWSARAMLNCLVRLYLCARLAPAVGPLARRLLWLSLLGGAVLTACVLAPAPLKPWTAAAATLGVWALTGLALLERGDRALMRNPMLALRASRSG